MSRGVSKALRVWCDFGDLTTSRNAKKGGFPQVVHRAGDNLSTGKSFASPYACLLSIVPSGTDTARKGLGRCLGRSNRAEN